MNPDNLTRKDFTLAINQIRENLMTNDGAGMLDAKEKTEVVELLKKLREIRKHIA